MPPTSHASTSTGYGVGNASNYGHVRLTDSTGATNAASSGVAASPKMVQDSISRNPSQTTLGSRTGITCTYRVWQGTVVECSIYGNTTANITEGNAISFGTLPAAYRPKSNSTIVCKLQGSAKAYFQVLTSGEVKLSVDDGTIYANASANCRATWLV